MAKSEEPRKKSERVQIVYSAPRKLLVGTSISRKGQELLDAIADDNSDNAKKLRAIITKKFSRNHYRLNRQAQPIKVITHKV